MPTKPSMRHKAETSARLDISHLVRAGIFPDLKRGTLGRPVTGDLLREGRRHCDFEAVAGESYRGVIQHLTLRLRFDHWDGYGADQRIGIVWASNRFVGRFAYFACPCCGSRVRYLYLCYGLSLRCRHCWGLINATETKSEGTRAIMKLRKIEAKIAKLETARMRGGRGRSRALHGRLCEEAAEIRRYLSATPRRRRRYDSDLSAL